MMPDPYFSEIKYLGGRNLDFIEVAVDAGASVADLVVTIYFSDGTIRSSNPLAGLTSVLDNGRDIYVIDTTTTATFTGVALSNAVALSDSSGVYSFVSFTDTAAAVTATEGPANGMTSDEIGSAGAGASLETTDRGATYGVQTTPTPNSVPCLTAGTRVQTRRGWIKVENLRSGDGVETLDGTFAKLRKVLRTKLTQIDLRKNDKLRPVKICAGAMGQGLPLQDLWVSRQHRMLIRSPIASRMFGENEVLVAAIKLVDLPGIYVDTEAADVTYFHLIFEKHEVIFAEGAPTESLHLGPEVLRDMAPEARAELRALRLLQRRSNAKDTTACLVPDLKRQARLVQRHALNQKPFLCA